MSGPPNEKRLRTTAPELYAQVLAPRKGNSKKKDWDGAISSKNR